MERFLIFSRDDDLKVSRLCAYINLFENVQNVAALIAYAKSSISIGDVAEPSINNSDDGGHRATAPVTPYVHVFLDPTLVCSAMHLAQAANEAVSREQRKSMKSKSLYSEIYYCLCSSPNIADAFKYFRLTSESRNVAVMVIAPLGKEGVSVNEAVCELVDGKRVHSGNLGQPHMFNREKFIKVMKITAEELSLHGGLEGAIATRIAVKGL